MNSRAIGQGTSNVNGVHALVRVALLAIVIAAIVWKLKRGWLR